jgi:hypothetical protein
MSEEQQPLSQEQLDLVKSLVAKREENEWFDPRRRETDEALAGVAGDLVAEIERLRHIFLAVANNFENCSHDDALLLARQYRAVARGER